jgi:hypothetical protein
MDFQEKFMSSKVVCSPEHLRVSNALPLLPSQKMEQRLLFQAAAMNCETRCYVQEIDTSGLVLSGGVD